MQKERLWKQITEKDSNKSISIEIVHPEETMKIKRPDELVQTERIKKKELCLLEPLPFVADKTSKQTTQQQLWKVFWKSPRNHVASRAIGWAGAQRSQSSKSGNDESPRLLCFWSTLVIMWNCHQCQWPGCFYVFQAFADLPFSFIFRQTRWRPYAKLWL